MVLFSSFVLQMYVQFSVSLVNTEFEMFRTVQEAAVVSAILRAAGIDTFSDPSEADGNVYLQVRYVGGKTSLSVIEVEL